MTRNRVIKTQSIEHACKTRMPRIFRGNDKEFASRTKTECANNTLQCCLVHKVRRLIAHVRHQDKAHLVADWHEVLDLNNSFHTPEQFQLRLTKFIDQWSKRYPSLRESLPEYKWRYYHQYLNYPVQLRRMLYTTNWIERFNKEVRKTTQHVNSFPNPDAALNLIFMVTKQKE